MLRLSVIILCAKPSNSGIAACSITDLQKILWQFTLEVHLKGLKFCAHVLFDGHLVWDVWGIENNALLEFGFCCAPEVLYYNYRSV